MTRSLQASTSSDATTSNAAIAQLQSTVDNVLARLGALPAPQPAGLTEGQVIALIDARLAQQRQQFQQSLQELQDLCETGFVNIQASFDAVGEWKEEVSQTFTKIQEWATAIEEKIIAPATNDTSREDSTRRSSHPTHLSSTPSSSSLPPSSWQTPAAPPIRHNPNIQRSLRLSDALDFTLATIPEQPSTPAVGEEVGRVSERAGIDELPSSTNLQIDDAQVNKPKKQVRISLPVLEEAEQSVEGDSANSATATAADALDALVDAHERSQNLIAFTPKQVTRTPIAARTLFGTEKSTEERFDDIVYIFDGSAATDTLPVIDTPAWTAASPSRLLRDASGPSSLL